MSHGEAPLKIFVFGSVNVDVSARMAALPRPGQTVSASGYGIGLGGKGANQAVAVAKLGGAIRFVGAVGHDAFGELALKQMREFGLDTGSVRVIDDVDTGMAIIQVEKPGRTRLRSVLAPMRAGCQPILMLMALILPRQGLRFCSAKCRMKPIWPLRKPCGQRVEPSCSTRPRWGCKPDGRSYRPERHHFAQRDGSR